MLTLHLYRHGQTNFNAEGRIQGQHDSVLTETGISQAKALQPFIRELGISSVYASSNVRARHTAEIMTEGLGLDLNLRDDLREIGMGRLETRLYKDALETDRDLLFQFRNDPEKYYLDGAETFQDVQNRGVATIENIISKELSEEPKQVLVVAHGLILKTILVYYAGLKIKDVWAEPLLTNCSRNILKANAAGERFITMVGDEMVEDTVWAA